MVPMLTCGLFRSNFAFATGVLLWTTCLGTSVSGGQSGYSPVAFAMPTARLRARSAPRSFLAAMLTRPSPSRCLLLDSGLAPLLARSSLRCSLARRLRDDLLRHVLRNLGVGLELHGVARPALGLRPQVADVAEHLRQRHRGADDAGAAALLHRLDVTAAGVEVADDVAHVLLGRDDLDRHHRLEDHRVGPAGSLLQRH